MAAEETSRSQTSGPSERRGRAVEKDFRLINIYLKIHHRKPLTMDDLGYLAEYDPECFAKTCKNVVYNVPETKPIMDPPVLQTSNKERKPELSERENIEKILRNLEHSEISDFPAADIDMENVKSLLGTLYMELLFPHNDKENFFEVTEKGSFFDKKA